MQKSSIPRHIRIAALQCDFEGGTENTLKVIDLWKDFGFNFEQLLHTHTELYSAVYDAKEHGNKLRRYLSKCREKDISILLYLNCHILKHSQQHKAAEWAHTAKNGEYSKLYETYYGTCLNSSWVDWFLATIETLRGLDISGIFFDGPVQRPCYCKICKDKFRKTYDISMAEATGKQIAEFNSQTILNFKKAVYKKVKAVDPKWVSYFNEGLFHARADSTGMRELLKYDDIIGTEGGFQFYTSPRTVDIWKCGSAAKLAEAVANGRNTVIFMAGDHKPWSWYLHTPAETTLCYMSALANGASVWYGIHSSTDLLRGKTGETVKSLVGFDKKHERLYMDTESVADVGLFYSFDTAGHYTTCGEETDFYDSSSRETAKGIGNYSESFSGTTAILFRSGINHDIVTELNLDSLSRYSTIVIPTGACMSAETGEKLREFVAGGGTLIADSEVSLYDEDFNKREDFLLSDVFGIRFQGYRKYRPFDYFAFADDKSPFVEDGVDLIPAPLSALDIVAIDNAKETAKLCPPMSGRYSGKPENPRFPFVIENRFGKGRAIYVAGTFFEMYRTYSIVQYREYIDRLIKEHSRPPVRLVNNPESVEFTVRRSNPSGELLVHLVNYSGGMNRPVSRIIPVTGLRLELRGNFSSAETLVGKQTLEVKDASIILPELREYEVVVLSP